ncbi:MAG: carboxypeptidase regulatory-like domain-containing protein, partial [Methyloprofundus sp.]|nr:carboxypeptidase regulatory-like domain-containing protein [Methyloprofundus sp.]
ISEPTELGTYIGQVVDVENSQPIAGAVITLLDVAESDVISAQDGSFSIIDVASGEHQLAYTAAGFATATQTATVVTGQFTSLGIVSLSALADKGVVFGVLRDAENEQAIASAVIEVMGSSASTTVVSNSDGFFSVELAPGAVSLVVQAAGFDTVTANADIVAGQRLNFSPFLNTTGTPPVIDSTVTVALKLVDTNTGQPIPEALVSIIGSTISAETNNAGESLLEGLAAGEFKLTISAETYQGFAANIIATEGAALDLGEISLIKQPVAIGSRTVKGRVTDAITGAAIAGASIDIVGTGVSVISNAEGFYYIEEIGASEVQLQVTAESYLDNGGTVTLESSGVRIVNVELGQALVEGVNIKHFQTSAHSYSAYELVVVDLELSNIGITDREVQLVGEVLNANDAVLFRFPFNSIATDGAEVGDVSLIPAEQSVKFEGLWPTATNTAGSYRVNIQVFDKGNGQLLTQKSLAIVIEETQRISLLSLGSTPNYVDIDSSAELALNITLQNLSNIAIESEYRYSLFNPDGLRIYTGEIVMQANAAEKRKTFILEKFSHLFNKNGFYTFELQHQSGLIAQRIVSDAISITPKISIEPSQAISTSTVFPNNAKRIKIDIRIKGVQQ